MCRLLVCGLSILLDMGVEGRVKDFGFKSGKGNDAVLVCASCCCKMSWLGRFAPDSICVRLLDPEDPGLASVGLDSKEAARGAVLDLSNVGWRCAPLGTLPVSLGLLRFEGLPVIVLLLASF